MAYGAGTYTYETATGSTGASFGGAPAADIMKSCSVAPLGNPAGGWAKFTSQNGTCSTVAGMPKRVAQDWKTMEGLVQRDVDARMGVSIGRAAG
ncbi:hypothetical protein [Streptomyces sp. NBC_01092]|uniref:hypothetical protein n=1 Tax=Streptomyces sp. NBC_01092 TaxID=2903748 RepID=UPI00386E4C95|nr:hypothetical protein OG254_26505 [Streptomyces sp. NBC_01092]